MAVIVGSPSTPEVDRHSGEEPEASEASITFKKTRHKTAGILSSSTFGTKWDPKNRLAGGDPNPECKYRTLVREECWAWTAIGQAVLNDRSALSALVC